LDKIGSTLKSLSIGTAYRINGVYLLAFSRLILSSSTLQELGWFKSYRQHQSIGRKGEPLPWITYPMINFLDGRIKKDSRVFEYGSGNSTLWWAKHCKQVISVEYDKSWYLKMGSKLPKNVSYIFMQLDNNKSYSMTILDTKKKFDIVMIDGRESCRMFKVRWRHYLG
jgi:hypothetical protein